MGLIPTLIYIHATREELKMKAKCGNEGVENEGKEWGSV